MEWVQAFKPRTWDSVIGQDHLKSVIQQALLRDKFPKFSLFTGPSGVGKSTIAELCALSLVCSENKAEPCLQCSNCRDFMSGGNRAIRKYNMASMLGKSSVIEVINDIFVFESITGLTVYILEEVHALREVDQAPFLEELTKIPDDVYVIMCTTNMYKVLPEIRNRAIIFNCTTPTYKQCSDFIKSICKRVGMPTPPTEVLKTLVSVCENTPRRLVNTLELFSTEEITNEKLVDFFGLTDNNYCIDLLEKLESKVSFFDFCEYLANLEDTDTTPSKLLRTFDSFMVDLLLSRSDNKKLKLLGASDRVERIVYELGEAGILKIMNALSEKSYGVDKSDNKSKFFLLSLKLSMSGSTSMISNQSNSQAIKINANEKARETTASRALDNAPEVLKPMTDKRIAGISTMFFTEEDD